MILPLKTIKSVVTLAIIRDCLLNHEYARGRQKKVTLANETLNERRYADNNRKQLLSNEYAKQIDIMHFLHYFLLIYLTLLAVFIAAYCISSWIYPGHFFVDILHLVAHHSSQSSAHS